MRRSLPGLARVLFARAALAQSFPSRPIRAAHRVARASELVAEASVKVD